MSTKVEKKQEDGVYGQGERENWEEVVEWLSRGLEVPLRAFCCKTRGGGGRLRHATEIEDKEKRRSKRKK